MCMPCELSDEVRVQPSLACINSLCQEVGFDPNTQTLAQKMADKKCVYVAKGCVLLPSGNVFLGTRHLKLIEMLSLLQHDST